MVADKSKKLKVGEKIEEKIDTELVLTIEKLQEVQDELDKINEEASDKVVEVEQKYNVVRKPVYDKRSEIIKSIPDFWLTAILSHPTLSELLNEEDQKIFKHLTSLDVEVSKDVKSGYSITFNFGENPYFENTKLTKTISFPDDGSTEYTNTTINWKEGMGLSNGVTEEKNGKKRPYEEDSFFTWFCGTRHMEESDEIHDGIAEMIKEDLWANPLTYFNNDADEEDFGDEEDEEDIGTDDSDEDN